MREKDYLLRLIQQFTVFLAKIIFNKKIQNYDQAFVEIDKALNGLLGLTHEDAISLPMDRLLQILRESAGAYAEKCYVLAELLREDGDITELSHKSNFLTLQNFERSLTLYLEALAHDAHLGNQETLLKMSALAAKLVNDPQGHYAGSRLLFRFYETVGEFDNAENMLFHLLKNGEREMVSEGLAFYQRLLSKDDAELQAGNLSREELTEGIAAVEKYA